MNRSLFYEDMRWPRPNRRLCGWCEMNVENNHLRCTQCLDGVTRMLCEFCALDQEHAKKAAAARERQGAA